MKDLRGQAIIYKNESYFVYDVRDKDGGKAFHLIGATYKEDKSNQIVLTLKGEELKVFLKEIEIYE